MRWILLTATIALTAVACGSDDTGGGDSTPEGGDGKYHPAPNGEHLAEGEACTKLRAAQENSAKKFQSSSSGCIITSRTCPDLLRVVFSTPCMEYDVGSIDGCIAYYDEAPGCDALRAAFDKCVVTPYPESAPNGCPAPN